MGQPPNFQPGYQEQYAQKQHMDQNQQQYAMPAYPQNTRTPQPPF